MYIKLCQISNDQYIEDCNGAIVLNEIQYPAQLHVEVIEWQDEIGFQKRLKADSFNQEVVTIDAQPVNIRDAVYQQLLVKYPNLVK
jgi:hypothetical protein